MRALRSSSRAPRLVVGALVTAFGCGDRAHSALLAPADGLRAAAAADSLDLSAARDRLRPTMAAAAVPAPAGSVAGRLYVTPAAAVLSPHFLAVNRTAALQLATAAQSGKRLVLRPVAAKSVTWTSSDTNVAVVAKDGAVTARGPGVAVVRGRAAAGQAAAEVRVSAAADTAPQTIAHRGYALLFPENTLPAFEGAFARGASVVELDVVLSRDSVPVILHDLTLDRTTNGAGPASARTAAELGRLDACTKVGGRTPCPVPTLAQALDVVTRAKGRALVELKGPWPRWAVNRALAAVRKAKLTDAAMILSFDRGVLRTARAADARIPLGYLSATRVPLGDVEALAPAAALVNFSAAAGAEGAAYVADARRRGLDVGLWTFTDPAQVRGLRARLGNVRVIADLPMTAN